MAQFNIPQTVEPVAKTQAIRILDVGLFGPMMVLSALKQKTA